MLRQSSSPAILVLALLLTLGLGGASFAQAPSPPPLPPPGPSPAQPAQLISTAEARAIIEKTARSHRPAICGDSLAALASLDRDNKPAAELLSQVVASR